MPHRVQDRPIFGARQVVEAHRVPQHSIGILDRALPDDQCRRGRVDRKRAGTEAMLAAIRTDLDAEVAPLPVS